MFSKRRCAACGSPGDARAATLVLLMAALGLWASGLVLISNEPTSRALRADESPAVTDRQTHSKTTPAEIEKLLSEFRSVYRLEKGQIIKRIKPPLPIGRLHDLNKWFPQLQVLKGGTYGEANLRCMVYRQRGGNLEEKAPFFQFSSHSPKGIEARRLVEVIAEVREERHIDDPDHQLDKLIEGDYVVDVDAPVEKRVARLAQILRREGGLAVELKLREVEEDIVAVSGRIKPPFVLKPDSPLELYAATLQPGKGETEKGTFQEFLDDVGRFITPNRHVINEVEHVVREKVAWHRNVRTRFDDKTLQEDREPRTVLDHLEEQTGLTFNLESRKFRTVVVSPSKQP